MDARPAALKQNGRNPRGFQPSQSIIRAGEARRSYVILVVAATTVVVVAAARAVIITAIVPTAI
jgi:hypothetical protein